MRVADYIADFLVKHGITDAFSVVGGGAMHLNDGLGHKEGLHVTYNHHEQACAIAAEAYARMNNRVAAVCVTTGPGGTNAITGVVGGWLDSIPMLVISGQVRYDTTARYSGLDIRALGDQEFDITKAVGCMTKYAVMVIDPTEIRYHLERALWLATHGRPGPSWLDIPLNVQAAQVDPAAMRGYDPSEDAATLAPAVRPEDVSEILRRVAAAKRPVLNAGAGIRISGGYEEFRELVEALGIPVVTGWDSIDLIEDDHPLYVGRAGIMGDRAGNFAIQNADLVLSIGSRLSIRQVGYTWEKWAPKAYVIMEDVCRDEMRKHTLHVDMPVWADAKELMVALNEAIPSESPVFNGSEWVAACAGWKRDYPVVTPAHLADTRLTNVYAFVGKLGRAVPDGQVCVVGNGSACVVGSHAWRVTNGGRFIINSAIASMGYDLPAAIGVSEEVNGFDHAHDRDIVLLSGDGSIQMNLQELETIIFHGMPIKIFVVNNDGYHSIRQTQTNMFNKNFCGIGSESADLGFPDLSKLAVAYGFPYFSCKSNDELDGFIADVMGTEGPVLAEVFCSREQFFEPKSATKKLEDGTLVSPPLEDLAPFLPREELAGIMSISEE